MSRELIEFHFNKLIKTLIVLSSSAEKQIRALSPNNIPVSLSVNIDCHFVDHRDAFFRDNYLNFNSLEYLDKIKSFMDKRSCTDENDQYYKFWTELNSILNHPDWEELRVLAGKCLKIIDLNQEKLIEIEHKIDLFN